MEESVELNMQIRSAHKVTLIASQSQLFRKQATKCDNKA